MSGQTTNNRTLKSAVSVSEMARMVGLSRARFYDLVREGIFLPPVYSTRTRRPLYTQDMQAENLLVKETQRGINGEYVIFYERREQAAETTATVPRQRQQSSAPDNLVQGLRSLGLTAVTKDQVGAAVTHCYPNGTNAVDDSEVLRTVFRHLRRQTAA